MDRAVNQIELDVERHVLNQTKRLSDNTYDKVITRNPRLESGVFTYNCLLCRVPNLPGERALQVHIAGKKHQSRSLSTYVPDALEFRSPFAMKSRMPYSSSNEPPPPGSEDDVQRISQLEINGKKQSKSLIGLEYVVELENFNAREPYYICLLCEKKCDPRNIIAQVTSHRHRMRYLDKHFATTMKTLNREKKFNADMTYRETVLCKISDKIEEKFGRQKPYSCNTREFERNKSIVEANVNSSKHVSEEDWPNCESILLGLIGLSSMDSELVSSEEDDTYSDKKRSVDLEPKFKGLHIFGHNSDLNQKVNGAKPKILTPRELNEQSAAKMNEKYVVEKYKAKVEIELEKLDNAYKEYEKSPEKHPKYSDEWKDFWSRRYKELIAQGKDANSHDYKPEWIKYWTGQMKKLHSIDIAKKKENIRKELKLSIDEVSRIEENSRKSRTDLEKGEIGSRGFMRSRTRKHSSSPIQISDDSDGEGTYRSNDPKRRRGSSPPRNNDRSSRHFREESSHSRRSNYRKDEYERGDPRGDCSSPERGGGFRFFKESIHEKKTTSRRDRNSSPERGGGFRNISESIHEKKSTNRRDSLSPPHRHEGSYRSDDDSNSRSSTYRYHGRQERMRHPYRSGDNDIREEMLDDGEVSLISVLRLLSALEQELGILASSVIELLQKALQCEKDSGNSSDDLLLNSKNQITLESVREKLKGLLSNGLLASIKIPAVKRAVQNIATLLHETNKKKQSSSSGSRSTYEEKLDPIENAKLEIAKVIMEKLKAEGRTEVPDEELEELIEVFLNQGESSDSGESEVIEHKTKQESSASKNEPSIVLSKKIETSTGLENLTDEDLKTLLRNFGDLTREEQEHLINYLTKIEQTEPRRVETLRRFVNIGDGEDLDGNAHKVTSRDEDMDMDLAAGVSKSPVNRVKPESPEPMKHDLSDDEDDDIDVLVKNLKKKTESANFANTFTDKSALADNLMSSLMQSNSVDTSGTWNMGVSADYNYYQHQDMNMMPSQFPTMQPIFDQQMGMQMPPMHMGMPGGGYPGMQMPMPPQGNQMWPQNSASTFRQEDFRNQNTGRPPNRNYSNNRQLTGKGKNKQFPNCEVRKELDRNLLEALIKLKFIAIRIATIDPFLETQAESVANIWSRLIKRSHGIFSEQFLLREMKDILSSVLTELEGVLLYEPHLVKEECLQMQVIEDIKKISKNGILHNEYDQILEFLQTHEKIPAGQRILQKMKNLSFDEEMLLLELLDLDQGIENELHEHLDTIIEIEDVTSRDSLLKRMQELLNESLTAECRFEVLRIVETINCGVMIAEVNMLNKKLFDVELESENLVPCIGTEGLKNNEDMPSPPSPPTIDKMSWIQQRIVKILGSFSNQKIFKSRFNTTVFSN